MRTDTKHLREVAEIYRRHFGQHVINAGHIESAADEIDRLREALTAIESARPHHYQMAFEDRASFAQRLKAMARAALPEQPVT